MLDFETFTARHGEVAAQALVENLERHQGIRYRGPVSLADRWDALMQPEQQQRFAA